MWHASIAKLGALFRGETVYWDRRDRRAARQIADKLLKDVGSGTTHAALGKSALHVRRKLSAEELLAIDQDWLALEAIDAAGLV